MLSLLVLLASARVAETCSLKRNGENKPLFSPVLNIHQTVPPFAPNALTISQGNP